MAVEGSRIKLAAFLVATGTRPLWLAERIGVSKGNLGDWLSGRHSVPEHQRVAILLALRERQALPVGDDLFDDDLEAVS